MARSKGSFGLAGAVEPKAAAPLDARAVVKNMGELTAVGSFPYPYIGMETYVVSENKKYRLIGNDPTVSANWEEVGSGGSGGGHTIEDPEGTALTQRDTLQFGGDLEVSDDDENEKTVVAPHELTAAELAEIVTPLPSVPVNMPILFDESGAEYQVGWYKYANGTKKPVYEKSFVSTLPTTAGFSNTKIIHTISNISDLDIFGIFGAVGGNANVSASLDRGFYLSDISPDYQFSPVWVRSNGELCCAISHSNLAGLQIRIILRYTKTTDTPT